MRAPPSSLFSLSRGVAIVVSKGKKTMRGPEDDAGLAGKVALITGGGAAGDGIGNGRAAAILLARAGSKVLVVDRELKLAERTVELISTEGGAGALRPPRFPRQQRGHRQPRQRGRRRAGSLAPGDAGQRRDHVPDVEA